jgi:hypothetical protein
MAILFISPIRIQWFVKKKRVCLELLHNKYIHAITGTRDSLAASIGEIIKIGAVNGRILQTIIPLLFTLPQRHNMKQVSKWSGFNENTIHSWYGHQEVYRSENCTSTGEKDQVQNDDLLCPST